GLRPEAKSEVPDVELVRALWANHKPLLRPFMSVEGGVMAAIALIDANQVDIVKAVDTIRQVKHRLQTDHQEISFKISGEAAMDATFMEAIVQDIIWIAPIQIGLIILLLMICLRSIMTTLVLLIVMGCAITITMGAAGWVGLQLNGVTSATPMILLGLAVATCIHLVIAWQQEMRARGDSVSALANSIQINAFPVFLTILSTVISFLCLNFSASPPFQQLGNLVAFGLVTTGVLAFTLLPALTSFLTAGAIPRSSFLETVFFKCGHYVVHHRAAFVLVLIFASCVAGWGLTKLTFDDRFSHYFSERFEFRRDTDFMEKHLTGLSVLTFPLSIKQATGRPRAPTVQQVVGFADWLAQQSKVTRVDGYSTLARRVLDGATSESALNRVEPTITAVLSNASSAEIRQLAERSKTWLGNHARGLSDGPVGTTLLAAYLSERNLNAMLLGTVAALVLVSLILLFALGNVRLGVISLVPNLVPMLLAYGAWGLTLGEMSFAATVVMALTFGIIVDDTVHFLSKYSRYRMGASVEQSVAQSFRTVGVAITATTVAVASGFLALCFSGFLVNQHLGLLTLLIVCAAWLAVLFLLPPLLSYLDASHTKTDDTSHNNLQV
ncbi:MAG: MMPL family transporter, partial [Rhizobiales bacterium]|nr:MMPL family transporter [Hyphomicrobiales bacterium]